MFSLRDLPFDPEVPRSPNTQDRLRILETPLAIWEPPQLQGPTSLEKWLDDVSDSNSTTTSDTYYNALTLDERAQYAVQPIDYTDYNLRIPLSPSIAHRNVDLYSGVGKDEFTRNELHCRRHRTPEWSTADSDDEFLEIEPRFKNVDELMDYQILRCRNDVEIMENEQRFRDDYNEVATPFHIRWGVQRWNRYRQDHPRACGGKLTPVPEQPFHLMGLSPEVRRLIFRFLFRGQLIRRRGVLLHMADDNSAGVDGDEKEPFDVRVFAVSKIIKREAMEVFFADNVFRIHVYDQGSFGWRDSEGVRPLSVFLRPGIEFLPIESLRRFDIVVHVNVEDDVRYFSSVAKRYIFPKHV
ncbi:MAG: hypothetical protein Q9195_009108 [Heterodermia aff. obscurata]